jgi:hypothetical protein
MVKTGRGIPVAPAGGLIAVLMTGMNRARIRRAECSRPTGVGVPIARQGDEVAGPVRACWWGASDTGSAAG